MIYKVKINAGGYNVQAEGPNGLSVCITRSQFQSTQVWMKHGPLGDGCEMK
jgi:hypothetical protein